MPVGKKLAVVLAVVVAGASMAFFFRKDASPFRFWQKRSDDPFDQRVERRVTTGAAWASRGRAATSGGQALRVPAAATAAISQPKGLGPDSQPSFQRNLSPVAALLPPIEGVVDEDDEGDTFGDRNSAAEHATAPAAGTSRHVVVDGDTLSTLASRYLGRAEAYLEIFELNRDVLASPDLLPIGAVLKIPPRREGGGANGSQQVVGGSENESDSPSQLVPVRGNPSTANPSTGAP